MRATLFLPLIFLVANADDSAVQQLTNGNNLFTQCFYNQLAKTEKGNFLISPFSAETLLSLAYSGAKGQTAQELKSAIHLPNDTETTESAFKTLLPKIKSSDYTIQTANKIYVKEGFSIREEFKTLASSVYRADIENINFDAAAEASQKMNAWVEKHTNNKIKDLINPAHLDKYSRAVFINALYFKANWSNPFLLASTQNLPFFKSDTDKVTVPMLQHFEENFDYFECPHLKAQFLRMPFKGGEASMTFVLPNDKNGLSKIEESLEMVFNSQHSLENTLVNVIIPKFKFESTANLKDAVWNLGAKLLFTEKQADISGISGDPGDLYVSKAVQKTFIDVNEEGVEAAAASYLVVAVPTSLRPGQPKTFRADHPFIFYITVGDLIIFAGRVTDPSAS